MSTRICLAGATGWVGQALVSAISRSREFELVSAVGKRSAGRGLDEVVLGAPAIVVSASVGTALSAAPDVFIDFTHPEVVRNHVEEAIASRVPTVIGTSGLAEQDYVEIDAAARAQGVGVLAAGNFSLTAALLERCAVLVARTIDSWEVIDYAVDTKPDSPSGTALELASKLGAVRQPYQEIPTEMTYGMRECRGAAVAGVRVHSVRLPGFVFAVEVIFGQRGERLSLRHEAGDTALPYVEGTLRAANSVRGFVGLRRGLEWVVGF